MRVCVCVCVCACVCACACAGGLLAHGVPVAPDEERKRQEKEEEEELMHTAVTTKADGTAVASTRKGGRVTVEVATPATGRRSRRGGDRSSIGAEQPAHDDEEAGAPPPKKVKWAKSIKTVLREERERVQALAPLHKLVVSGCQLSDMALQELAKWPYLLHLSVSRCDDLTDHGGVALAESCTNLKVRLRTCAVDTLMRFASLFVVCFLRWLVVRHALTAGVCMDVQSLSLAYCHSLKDGTVRALADNCHQLRSLSMQGMWDVTDEAFYELGGVRLAAVWCVGSTTRSLQSC